MGRKRTAKVVVKKKVPSRVTKAAAAATPPAKKRGRPSTKQPEKSKNLSIADIVKDKNVSTCEECGGVWFSDVLFQKHLTICKKPNSSVASSSKEAITNEVIAIKTKVPDLSITFEKKKNADTSGKTNINAVAKAGLQSIMSNKVQSLLASRSQDIAEDVDSDSSVEETNIRSAVSISASNLRKNIASSMMKSNAENSGRPTRNSGLPTSSPSKASSASSQADLLAKKTLESSTTAGNKVVASVEVHSSANQRGKENGSPTKLGAPRLKDLPRNIRGRKSDAAFDALTTLSSVAEEQIVDDPLEVQTRNKIRRTPNKPAREIITLDDATNNGDAISAETDKASKNRTSPRGRRALANKSVPEMVASTSIAVENAPTPKKRGRKPKNKEVEEIDPVKDKQKSATSIIYDVESAGIIIPGEPEILNPLEAVKEEEDESEQKFDSQESGSNDDPNAVTFTCAVCQKSFTRKYQLDRHLKISKCSGLPLPSFPCELCNRVYTRKDNLREHLRSHTGEVHRRKNHKCPYCDKAFHGQSLLAIHIRKHTGEKPFACDFCPKRFPSTGALTKHRMTHTGEKPYSCNECGRKFTLKGTLSRHLRTHTGIRPHTCTFCGKKFIQIGGLNAHMFYHTGENGFKCEDCGKVFNRKARLQMHQLYVHIKLKPFTCEHCSKQFTRKEDLMRHAVLHTGEKPYKCPTCDRGFSVKPSLKIHLLTHTKEEPRSCHECGRAFIRKDCLLRHMRKRHRDVFDKLLFDEKDKKDVVNTRVLSEKDLTENIRELLYLLIDEPTLVGFGWPDKAVDEVLELVIQRCGHTPVSRDQYNYMDRLRENAKLLFTVVIDDNAVKTLLNNQTVDEVILHVLRLAKT